MLCNDRAILVEEHIMGVNHLNEIYDAAIEWETPSHKLLAVTMAYYADKKGIVRLTQDELAEAVVLGRRRVSTLIDDLCDLGIIKRLGHGRYGMRFGLPKKDEDETLPSPKGATAELKRLQAIRTEEQGIVWRKDGWPILQDVKEVLAHARERTL